MKSVSSKGDLMSNQYFSRDIQREESKRYSKSEESDPEEASDPSEGNSNNQHVSNALKPIKKSDSTPVSKKTVTNENYNFKEALISQLVLQKSHS